MVGIFVLGELSIEDLNHAFLVEGDAWMRSISYDDYIVGSSLAVLTPERLESVAVVIVV